MRLAESQAPHEAAGLLGLTPHEVAALREQAMAAKACAYCPYSQFRVGCAVLVTAGTGTAASASQASRGVQGSAEESAAAAVAATDSTGGDDLTARIIIGANVENAAYPVGTCAERVALATAVVAGHRPGNFRALAVATDLVPPASPCGMCRQFIREFCHSNIPILLFDKNGDCVAKTLEELLPMSFGPEMLPPPPALAGPAEGYGSGRQGAA